MPSRRLFKREHPSAKDSKALISLFEANRRSPAPVKRFWTFEISVKQNYLAAKKNRSLTCADTETCKERTLARLTSPSTSPCHFEHSPTLFEQDFTSTARLATLEGEPEGTCKTVKFKKYPGVSFMVEKDVVTRADAKYNTVVPKAYEIAKDARLDEIKRKHPTSKIKQHQYDEEGHYLVLDSKDGKRAVLFEESKGKVTGVRAGFHPSVGYVEGSY